MIPDAVLVATPSAPSLTMAKHAVAAGMPAIVIMTAVAASVSGADFPSPMTTNHSAPLTPTTVTMVDTPRAGCRPNHHPATGIAAPLDNTAANITDAAAASSIPAP